MSWIILAVLALAALLLVFSLFKKLVKLAFLAFLLLLLVGGIWFYWQQNPPEVPDAVRQFGEEKADQLERAAGEVMDTAAEAVKEGAEQAMDRAGEVLQEGAARALDEAGNAFGTDRVEDCILIDPEDLVVTGRYVETNDTSLLLPEDPAEAERYLATIRHFNLDRVCYVGRPDPSMEYWLAGGSAPTGSIDGKDCIWFDREALAITENPHADNLLIVWGEELFDYYPNRAEAEQTIAIINKYSFEWRCYVGRPGPSMTYYR